MRKIYLALMVSAISLAANGQVDSFTANGTFTVPSGITSVTVEVIGAGGRGGSNGGGGGGGGGYASGVYTVTPNVMYVVVVGLANSGTGTSSVTGLGLSATKGANGTTVSHPTIGGGGAGGTGIGGQTNRTGGTGGGGYYTYFGGGGGGAAGSIGNGGVGGNTITYLGNCLTPGGSGGLSGGYPGGAGGKGAGFTDANCNVTDSSTVGENYGAGGGGGNGNSGPAASGANGFVMFSWCSTLNPPTGHDKQSFCDSATVADLVVQGTGIKWYRSATGGTALNDTVSLVDNTSYFAEQTTGPCTSDSRFEVMVTIINIDAGTTLAGNTITANESGADYAWLNCTTNQIIPNETAQSFTPTASGSYAAIITNGICSDTSACVTIDILGISNPQTNTHFKIYPNPAKEIITIQITDFLKGEPFIIMDQHGKKVKSGSLDTDKTNINIKDLANGIYLIKIGDKEKQTFKVIKR